MSHVSPRARSFRRQQPRRWLKSPEHAVPTRPGVYAVFSAGQLVYVGSALNLRERLQEHGFFRRWPRRFCRFGEVAQLQLRFAVDARPGFHLAREFRLIRRLAPPLNSVYRARR